MNEQDTNVDDQKEAFQLYFTNKVSNILKVGIVGAAFASSSALSYSAFSPYMTNFMDVGGMLNGLGSVINCTNPIVNEIMKNAMVLNFIGNSVKEVMKQRDFFMMKGKSVIYSLAGKIYDADPSKYQDIEVKEPPKAKSTLEKLEETPIMKANVIRQAQRLLIDYEKGENPTEKLTNSTYSLSDVNIKIANIISERLEAEGFEVGSKKGKDAILNLQKNPLSIQSEDEKEAYIEFVSDNSKLNSIYSMENDTNKLKKFLITLIPKRKTMQIEDSKTQKIRSMMRQKIQEFNSNGRKESKVKKKYLIALEKLFKKVCNPMRLLVKFKI